MYVKTFWMPKFYMIIWVMIILYMGYYGKQLWGKDNVIKIADTS